MKQIRKSTIDNFIKNINECAESGLTRAAYCAAKQLYSTYFSVNMNKMIEGYKSGILSEEQFNNVVEAMSKLDSKYIGFHISRSANNTITQPELPFEGDIERVITSASTETLDSDDRSEVSYERGEDGKILAYVYKIYRRNKPALSGRFTRNEMNDIYRLYSYYGTSLTQREISRHFPELSLVDFKRILRAFNIYKASAPFAPHMFEEYSEEDLRAMQLREKENDFLKKAEEDRVKNNEKLLRKYAQENIELKGVIKNLQNIDFKFLGESLEPTYIDKHEPTGKDLILHLSDLHIGAKVESGSLYPNPWNEEEIIRRLKETLNRISSLGTFDTVIVNLLGDNLDGMDNQTARRDHFMPQNMDNVEQVQVFIRVLEWFISSLYKNNICNNLKIYSVKCGNHDGTMGYVATMALLYKLKLMYPDIETTLFDEFYGFYKFKGHTWILTHGKDEKFMKKGLPLNLDDKNKVMIYEWLDSQNIYGDNIHVIKGDLHTENINSCKKLDYRNVLSLFGASDYSNYNFSRNQYGVSYELFIGDNLLRGTFENM